MQTKTTSDAGRVLVVRLLLLAGVCAAICTLVAVPRAEASKKHGPLTILPARPSDSQALKVTWRPAYAWPAKGMSYQFEIVTGDGNTCERSAARLVTKRWSKGDVLRGTLRPVGGVWCPGVATVVLRAVKNEGSAPIAKTLAVKRLTIRDDPATPPAGVGPSNGRSLGEPIGTPADLVLLSGSTLTVRVPGRPDRSASLDGRLRGFVPGRYVADRDFMSYFTSVSLRLSGLAADPLCTAAAIPDALTIAGSTQQTTMTKLTQAKVARMVLALAQDPLLATGCQGPLPATPRKLLLEAAVGAAGVKRLELNGTLGGLRLNEGVDAELVVKLVAKLEVSS